MQATRPSVEASIWTSVSLARLSAFDPDKKDRNCIIEKHICVYFNNVQMYEKKAFYVIGMFLDIRFVECVWVCLRQIHSSSFVAIQMTGILYKIIYFGLDCIMILLLFMNLHEIQMPVMGLIKCFVSIYNAVHDLRIVHNLDKNI